MALGTPLPTMGRRVGGDPTGAGGTYMAPESVSSGGPMSAYSDGGMWSGARNAQSQAYGRGSSSGTASYRPPTPAPTPRPTSNPRPMAPGGMSAYSSGGMWSGGRNILSQQYSSNPGFGNAYQYYSALMGPDMAQLGVTDAGLGMQLGQYQAQHDLQSGYLNQDLGFGNREIDLQMANLGIDQGAAQRQWDNLATQLGWSTEDLQRRLGYVDQYESLANQVFGQQQNYIGQQQQFNQTGYGLDIGNINQNARTDIRAQLDDAAARGANTTTGNTWAIDDIHGTRQYQLGKAKLSRDDVAAGLDNQSEQARLDLARQLLGFDEQRGELNSGYRQEQLSLREQQQQSSDALRGLDIRAQELGLSREQLQSNIQRQLEQSNLDRFFGIADVMNALNSNDIQRQQIAEQIIRQATASASLFR